jgi:Flp pilus assembly protein TadG
MLRRARPPDHRPRRGLAAAEFALLLPLICFLLVATADYARVFYYAATLDNCARNGALYGCRSKYDPQSPYATLQAAALADATNVQPAPAISSTTGVDTNGQAFIQVTASYPFQTLVNYQWLSNMFNLQIPHVVNLQRSVWMPITPDSPLAQ